MPQSVALEELIAEWRARLRRRRAVHLRDVDEMESLLRGELAALSTAGLTDEEAFLVAVRRMDGLDTRPQEFARTETVVVLSLAVAAALAIKVPELFGLRFGGGDGPFYARNASLFVLPLVAAYFAWKRGLGTRGLWLALPFAGGAVVANVFPFAAGSQTAVLSALHLPIALWLAVGVAYVGGRWFAGGGRMDFVRFSGELAIYYALIALGGGVLTAFTMMIFDAIEIDARWLAEGWLIPCGAMGAAVVSSWLVEAREGVVENMAPVLTRLFTPLLTFVLLAFLATMAWTGSPINVEREVLIGFDLLLVLVVGLVLYAASARGTNTRPGFFDALQLLLVVSALIVDAAALAAVGARISEFGFSPNRVAALGENLILLANLVWFAWLYARFLRGRVQFASLERWQVTYLPVYSVWAAIVVVVFPPLFGYR